MSRLDEQERKRTEAAGCRPRGRVCSREGAQERPDLPAGFKSSYDEKRENVGKKGQYITLPLSRVPCPKGWKGKVVSVKHFTYSLQKSEKGIKMEKNS